MRLNKYGLLRDENAFMCLAELIGADRAWPQGEGGGVLDCSKYIFGGHLVFKHECTSQKRGGLSPWTCH